MTRPQHLTAVLLLTAALVLAAVTGLRAQVLADDDGGLAPMAIIPPVAMKEAPRPTSAGYIALLYHRMTGQVPDYEAWAMASDDYAKANSFDKDLVRREKAAEAARAYHLVTYDEPLIIQSPVTLSSYSRAKKGFFVQDLRPDNFYSYEFIGRNYAVVPLDMMDFQWLEVQDPEAQKRLEDAVKAADGKVLMYIYLTPTFADKQTPMMMNNKEYWLLSGRVQKLLIFNRRGKKLLWEGYGKAHVEQRQQEVLDLYK